MKRKKGQALLEIAIVLPILLLVFCAICDFGRILYASAQLNMVAEEAVRLAGLGKADTDIVNYVNNEVYLIDKDTIITNIIPNYATRKSGDYVTVKIIYKVKYVTPLMNKILPSPFEVDTKSTIRVEWGERGNVKKNFY